jgi:hypothetical protein
MQVSYTNWIQSSFSHSISILINGQLKAFQWKLAEQGCANQVTEAIKFLYNGAYYLWTFSMSLAPCHISGTLNFEVALDLYKICALLRRNSKKNFKFPGLSHAVTLMFWLYNKEYISFVHDIKT